MYSSLTGDLCPQTKFKPFKPSTELLKVKIFILNNGSMKHVSNKSINKEFNQPDKEVSLHMFLFSVSVAMEENFSL